MKTYKTIVSKIAIPADKKIKQKQYLTNGAFPIVDQGQKFIGGYTDDCSKLITCELPVIVFGDHSKIVKYIDFPFCAGADGIKILKANANISPKYLYYGTLFLSYCIQDKGYARHYQFLEKKKLLVLPLAEQERVVTKIEELFSQFDDAVAELKKAKEKLNVYRQAVLKEAFGSYMTNLTPFHFVADCRLGKMLDKEKNNGDFKPYLRNENVRWFSFDLSDVKQMRFKKEELETFSIKRNDLVICEGGEPGRCAVWNENQTICFQKALHRVRLKGERNPLFYMYLFNYYSVSGFLKPFFTGSGIKHLPQEKLVLVPVPDPRKEEQYNTVLYIEEKLSLFSNFQKEIDKSIQLAIPLRQSILKLAFEGKL